MATNAGSISESAFKVITTTLFGVAIATATLRTGIRVRFRGRLLADDVVLLVACASLIGANVLLWTMIPSLYMADFIYINPTPATLRKLTAEPAYRRRTIWFRKMVTAFSALTWTAIYGVKLCYLLFFHLLVVRITRYLLIWKCIFVTTVILFVFCICCDYIGCPYFNIQVLKCLQNPGLLRNLAVDEVQIFMDIVTDILILIIPILVLWNVQLGLRQKLLLAVFLCLNICMIMIAVVRASGIRFGAHKPDTRYYELRWLGFWQDIEAEVSVIMVSITAFRSLLGMKASDANERRHQVRRSGSHPLRLRRSPYSLEDDSDQFPPLARMAGGELLQDPWTIDPL